MGIFESIKNVFDSSLNSRQLQQTMPTVKKIKELREEYEKEKTSFEDFRKRIKEMRNEINELVEKLPDEAFESVEMVEREKGLDPEEILIQDKLREFLPEVFAMVDAVYHRKLGKQYYDVQLQAATILADGQRLVEQYTGEGKTMTFQLPLVLYSLVGRGSHLITVNEYLTKVGAEYAGHIFAELGITVGINVPGANYKFVPDSELETVKGEEAVELSKSQVLSIDKMEGVNLIEVSKREAYSCDVLYSTNNELGFDYLRDNMARSLGRIVQRELYFCIIDEADSILIDEARTPLIISATPTDADTEKYERFANAVSSLKEEEHYEIDHKGRSVTLTEQGIEQVERNLEVDNLWKNYGDAFHLENALKAKALFTKGDEYMVKQGNVYIVDEFTGRVLEGRRYSEGLHQAIEAKEGVEIQQESKTFATITFQNLFRLYKVLCGGSGTIMTEAEEFYKIYGLESVVIPTNKPRIRIDHPDRIYRTQEAKFKAVVQDVKEQNEIGRPILIGTTSVENSEIVSELLDQAGVDHEVLNAKFHEQESRIVSNAGKRGAVTVATNMAGRGTDIVIGGGERGDDYWQEIADLGGLYVIGTERHDSRRIDNQLRGRTGRQGEPGSTRFYVSLEDKIMRVLGGEMITRLMNMIQVPDDMPIEMNMITKQIETAQKRIEGVNFDSRKQLVDYDDVVSTHRQIFYKRRRNLLYAGENAEGLFLEGADLININTETHKDKKEKYEPKLKKAQGKVVKIAEETATTQIVSFVDELQENEEEDRVKLLKKIDGFVPLVLQAGLLGMTKAKVETQYKEKFEKEDWDGIEEMLRQSFDKKLDEFDDEVYRVVKIINLDVLDNSWVEHLEIMKGLRESVRLEGFAQRKPIVEYKNRAFGLFESFIDSVNQEFIEKLFRLQRVQKVQASPEPQNIETNQDEVEDVLEGDREFTAQEAEQKRAKSVIEAIQRKQARTEASLKTNSSENTSSRTKVNTSKEYGRNDRVTVKMADGTVKKNVKYKKVQDAVESGDAVVVEK